MKTSFEQQINEIARAAKDEIYRIVADKKELILFTATGKEEFGEEWSLDIYDDVPDFAFYDKHDGIEYAAIKELRLEGEHVYITGILKRDSYPDQVQISLLELEPVSCAALADFIIADN